MSRSISFPEWVYNSLLRNGNVYLPTATAKNFTIKSLEKHLKNKLNMKVRVRVKTFDDSQVDYKAYKQKRIVSEGFIAEIV